MSRDFLSALNIPFVTVLPASAQHNDLCLTDLNYVCGGTTTAAFALCRFNSAIGGIGAWMPIQTYPVIHSVVATALAAGTGFREPTTTPNIVVPYQGSYVWDGLAEIVASAADPLVQWGVGTVAGGATSVIAQGAAGSTGAASFRSHCRIAPMQRVNTTGATANDLTYRGRASSSASVGLTFGRSMITCTAAYCYGTA